MISDSIFRKRSLLRRSTASLIICCLGFASSSLPAEEELEATGAKPPGVAVLPTFTDVGTPDTWRPWAAGFDAALQAELLQGWNVAVTSRAGLSTVVFDQKLAFAKGERGGPPQVQAADFSIFLVLDARKSEVRVHVTPVSKGMKISAPVIHKFRSAYDYSVGLPKKVAQDIARQIGLHVDRNSLPPEVDANTTERAPLKIAIVPPFSTIDPQYFTAAMATLFVAMLEEGCLGLEQPVELVERTEIVRLLGERELLAQGITTKAGLDANTAANIARLAGARITLILYLHPVGNNNARITIHAIDSESGEIVAAQSWTGKVSEPAPNGPLSALLTDAIRVKPDHVEDVAASKLLRHAESDHLVGLYDTMIHTNAGFREQTLLSLILADAAIALSYDDPDRYSKVISRFLYRAFPWKNSEILAWSETASDRAYKHAEKDGSLAEITRQARRVFELPIRELRESRDNNIDIHRQSWFMLASGDPQAALDLLLAIDGGLETIARFHTYTQTYAMALIELGRTSEAVGFLLRRYAQYKTEKSSFFLLLDVLRLEGDSQREINLMYREHKMFLKDFSTARLARFLEIAAQHRHPDWCLQVFYSLAHPWRRNKLPVMEQLVRLRMALNQKERAIGDAQCGHLFALLEEEPEFIAVFTKLLDELNSKPLKTLPAPASVIKLSEDSRIDLFHDPTVSPERAAKIGQLIANFWNCEVHVLAAPLDASKLEAFDHASQRIIATDLADHMFPLIRPDDGLLQAVFLTARPIRSSVGAIYGTTSHYGIVNFVSTYYFDYFQEKDKPSPAPIAATLDEMVAIAAVQGGIMSSVISKQIWLDTKKIESFHPLPPEAMASSGTLQLNNRLLGVSPHTARAIAKIQPGAFRESANIRRDKLLESMAGDKSPDTAAFRKIAALLSKTEPTILNPEEKN